MSSAIPVRNVFLATAQRVENSSRNAANSVKIHSGRVKSPPADRETGDGILIAFTGVARIASTKSD